MAALRELSGIATPANMQLNPEDMENWEAFLAACARHDESIKTDSVSIQEARSRMEYGDTEVQLFIQDLELIGIDGMSKQIVRQYPWRGAVIKRFMIWLQKQGVAADGATSSSQDQGSARQDPVASVHANIHLAKVVAAAATRDTEKLSELTDEAAPNEGLRKLLAKMQQGEPLKELGPDECLLTQAREARKQNRFPMRREVDAEALAKWQRPLATFLVSELPRIWAAVLEHRMSFGDAFNLIGQAALVATDRRAASAHHGEAAAVLYAERLLRDVYHVSKRGKTDEQGRENVAQLLSELDVARCSMAIEETEVLANGGGRGSGNAGMRVCVKNIFGLCDQEDCGRPHGCPFCTTQARNPFKWFASHLSGQGYELRPIAGKDNAFGGKSGAKRYGKASWNQGFSGKPYWAADRRGRSKSRGDHGRSRSRSRLRSPSQTSRDAAWAGLAKKDRNGRDRR